MNFGMMEAQNLKNEIIYLSNLINSHQNAPNMRNSTYSPASFTQKHGFRSNFRTNEARTSSNYKSTFVSRTPTIRKTFKLVNNNQNPFKMVKTNSTNKTLEAKSEAPLAQNRQTLAIEKSKLPTVIVINNTLTTPNVAKLIESKCLTNQPLNMKYKLIKNQRYSKTRQEASFTTSTPTVVNSNTSNIRKKPFQISKFKVVNKMPLVSPILRKKWNPGFGKPKWWSNSSGYNGFLKKYQHTKFRPIKNKYRFNKADTTLIKGHKNCEKNRKIISIGGLMYRVTSTKLSRAQTPKKTLKINSTSLKLSPKFIYVRGIRYKVSKTGNTLKRMPNKWNKSTSIFSEARNSMLNRSRIDIGGKTFVKNQEGIFIASQVTQARSFANRAVSRSIHRVLNRTKRKRLIKINQQCLFFVRFGKCHKGKECDYVHDPSKIAVCTRFLRGTCKISNCPFSHKIAPEKMPVCSYYLQGRCSNENCPYRHVNVSASAGACKNFLNGYCPDGEKCKKLHILDCQEFRSKGTCSKGKNCLLRHKKITRKRKISIAQTKEVKVAKIETKFSIESMPSFISINSPASSEKSVIDPVPITSLKIKPRFLKKLR